MNQNLKLTTAAFVIFISAAACQQTVSNNSTANNTIINTASKASNSAANADTAIASANSPTAAYVAAYNARKNKDIVALRGLLSKDIIEFFKIMGEEDKKSVDDMLKELADRPQAATAEARNEKINGDKATIEYLDEDGKWTPMDLVKEDGVWKLTLAVGDPQDEVRSNSNK